MNRVVKAVGDSQMKTERPEFGIGDTVDVYVRIKEGERERVQVFNGTVIARRGNGVNESFTVRHLFQGEGVERVFPVHCPSVEKVEVKRKGKIRRAKLYFLRDRTGRATRLAEKRTTGAKTTKKAQAQAVKDDSAKTVEKASE
jgi:large subunit ribosomal protein L19